MRSFLRQIGICGWKSNIRNIFLNNKISCKRVKIRITYPKFWESKLHAVMHVMRPKNIKLWTSKGLKSKWPYSFWFFLILLKTFAFLKIPHYFIYKYTQYIQYIPLVSLQFMRRTSILSPTINSKNGTLVTHTEFRCP